MREVNDQLIRTIFKPRALTARKYDYGHLMVVGGSKLYTGAPTLAGMAAMRTGCDVVTMAAPRRAADVAANMNPGLVTWPLEGDILYAMHMPELRKLIEEKTACVIGNGLGKEEPTLQTVRAFLKECPIPCVVDADAIRGLVNQRTEVVKGKPYVLTPHAFEFSLITGIHPGKYPLEERIGIVKNAAKTLKCVVVLKGHEDIISDGREIAVNRTGSPYMTKGGTGDTLAGIIGALLARAIEPFEAAQAGCWINGKAGERAGHLKGEGMLATDLIDEIPHVLVETLEFVHD